MVICAQTPSSLLVRCQLAFFSIPVFVGYSGFIQPFGEHNVDFRNYSI